MWLRPSPLGILFSWSKAQSSTETILRERNLCTDLTRLDVALPATTTSSLISGIIAFMTNFPSLAFGLIRLADSDRRIPSFIPFKPLLVIVSERSQSTLRGLLHRWQASPLLNTESGGAASPSHTTASDQRSSSAMPLTWCPPIGRCVVRRDSLHYLMKTLPLSWRTTP